MKKKKINEGLVDKLYQGLLKMVMTGKTKQAKSKVAGQKELQDAIDDLEFAKNKLRKATQNVADYMKQFDR